MPRTKQKQRKTTGNGGYKRQRAMDEAEPGPRKKLKTEQPMSKPKGAATDKTAMDLTEFKGFEDEDRAVEVSLRTQDSRSGPPASEAEAQPGPARHNDSISTRDPALLSDLFAQTTREHFHEITTLEQRDLSLPSSIFRDTTDFKKPHTQDNLPAYLEAYTEGGKEALSTCSKTCSPHTAVVAASGQRVADLYRTLLVYNTKTSKVGKIIAKHMKLKDTVRYLKENQVGVVVITPQRLKDLISEGAVNIETLQRIVIDGSHRNQKDQTIFDMKGVFVQLTELLNMQKMKPNLGVANGRIEIMVY